ncbi:HNH endonuclease signature motif containing protein [Cryobacterium cryoconiti]|uniref:HNH endonuclease n=1 Tax=Cryobacterium cryoconiti TaxID=1259239 RepID=A0A4Y8JYB3_9MICO|nr:HNH endonuclease signature motif containing protein [Cryobacterium cryoconiti]TFD31528.1 HNH endonuclease [Cryobacterium cryoconiti]
MTTLVEHPAADAAPGPFAAARVVAELQALAGELGETLGCSSVRGLDDDGLLQVTTALEGLGRRVDALRVAAAGEVADRSRPELGTGQLSARKGCRTAGELLERLTLVSGPTAGRRMRLGKQLRTGRSLSGEPLPPTFPATSIALATGAIGVDTADAILTALTPTLRCTDLDSVQAAESELVATATGTSAQTPVPAPADEVRLQGSVWKAVLAPDGSRPDDHAAVARSFRLGRERDGVVPVSGSLMPEIAGKLRRLFDAYLSPKSAPVAFHAEEDADTNREGLTPEQAREQALLERDDRTPDQRRHDVFAVIVDVAARAGEAPTIGGAPATVLVSVREQDLNADFGQGRGVGWIDGVDSPIPITAVKDLISTGGQQKVVINDEGRIIKLGSPERCFTPAQRRAIQLRDGTCIIPWCKIPAGMTEIHHVIPHSEGGETHTDNGVCLCWFHHRYLAASGWAIRMVRGAVQIMAPPWLETGARKWRAVTKSRTRMTDSVERTNVSRDDE